MVWDEDIIRHLRELWALGLSTAEIGRRLGVSKNAIVGKAHRLDLDGRPSPIRRDGAKPASDRPAYPRMAGPTLPPLASTSLQPLAVPSSNVQPLRTPPIAGSRRSADVPAPAPRSAMLSTPLPASGSTPLPANGSTPLPAMPRAPIQTRRPAPACCWPIGEPGTKTFRFCDDTSAPGKPYCNEHAKLAYVRVRDRKEDAA